MTSPHLRRTPSRRCFARQPTDWHSVYLDRILRVQPWILPHLHTKKVLVIPKPRPVTTTHVSILTLVYLSWVYYANLHPLCIYPPRVEEGFYTLLPFCPLSNSMPPLGHQKRKKTVVDFLSWKSVLCVNIQSPFAVRKKKRCILNNKPFLDELFCLLSTYIVEII